MVISFLEEKTREESLDIKLLLMDQDGLWTSLGILSPLPISFIKYGLLWIPEIIIKIIK